MVLAQILSDPPPALRKLTVYDFLLWARRTGRRQALAYLAAIDCSEWRMVGEMTPRQRSLLQELLEEALAIV